MVEEKAKQETRMKQAESRAPPEDVGNKFLRNIN
jgi:hypothetical protein